MSPYFKPSQYKKHVNEPQKHTQHTKNNVNTLQLQPTQPSSHLNVSKLPQQAQPIIVPTTFAQPATHLAQPAQNTEPSQTKGNGTTSTDTNNQQIKMPYSAQKSQQHSTCMSPTTRSKRTRHSSTDCKHFNPITSIRTKIEKS